MDCSLSLAVWCHESRACHACAQERGVEVVTWEGWKRIDAEEVRLGSELGRSRVKITSVHKMLQIVRENA